MSESNKDENINKEDNKPSSLKEDKPEPIFEEKLKFQKKNFLDL